MSFLSKCLLLCALFLLKTVALTAQVIDAGDVVREGVKPLPVSIASNDVGILQIAQRAFELHGGYRLAAPAQAVFSFRIEQVEAASVLLKIYSGKPAQEQFRSNVDGRDLRHAILRACDQAVEATLHTKGFFAGKLAFVCKQNGVSEIYASDMLFNRVRVLTADRSAVASPDWSPDGKKLLYMTYHKSGFPDIYMLDLSSRRKEPIAAYGGTNASPAFSPDGRRIAMALSGSGNSEIVVADAMGQNGRPITRKKSIETSPSWSPDGRSIVLESDMLGRPQLYEIPAKGGSMRRIPTNISGYCSEPAWNPVDKNLIAFTAAVRDGFQIAVYDRQSRRSEILTSVSGFAVEPEWLSDGRHLIFTQKQRGSERLMVLDSKTKSISALHSPDLGKTSSAAFVY